MILYKYCTVLLITISVTSVSWKQYLVVGFKIIYFEQLFMLLDSILASHINRTASCVTTAESLSSAKRQDADISQPELSVLSYI